MSQFRTLHQKGNPFVLVNVWDKGSAQVMAALGAKALATSSIYTGTSLSGLCQPR
jgi:2-methylisocitrate lyase-like PEP mutase family enzyme